MNSWDGNLPGEGPEENSEQGSDKDNEEKASLDIDLDEADENDSFISSDDNDTDNEGEDGLEGYEGLDDSELEELNIDRDEYTPITRDRLTELGLNNTGKKSRKSYDVDGYERVKEFDKFHNYLETEGVIEDDDDEMDMYSNIKNSVLDEEESIKAANITMNVAISDEIDGDDPLDDVESNDNIFEYIKKFNKKYI